MVNMLQTAGEKEKKSLYSASGRWMVELSALQEAMDTVRFTPTFCLEVWRCKLTPG
jgi:hypothetical protein